MKASELIIKLNELINKHGDYEVFQADVTIESTIEKTHKIILVQKEIEPYFYLKSEPY